MEKRPSYIIECNKNIEAQFFSYCYNIDQTFELRREFKQYYIFLSYSYHCSIYP